MPRIEPRKGPGLPPSQIMSIRNDVARDWLALDEKIRFSGLLPVELKEEVRRALAQVSGCQFCASLGQPQGEYSDPRVQSAVEFARELGANPTGISDERFADLKKHFSEEEIVELGLWAAFMFGSEMFGAMMKLDPATPEQFSLYSRWLEQGYKRSRPGVEQA